jgi:hypothetical protein
MKSFLENFAAILGVFTIIVLAMSWSHEYGYFWSVGRQFQTFLTTSDYLTNDVLWLPLALFLVYNWVDWHRFKEEGPPPIDWKSKGTWVWLAVGALIFILSALALTWPLPSLYALNVLLAMSIAWSYLWRGYVPTIELEEPWKYLVRQAVRFGPPLMMGMFIYGSIDANIDLTRMDNPYAFEFRNQNGKVLRVFLRNFDKGVLVRDAIENRIEFYRWDDITVISKVASKPSRTLQCWAFGWRCDEPEPPKP